MSSTELGPQLRKAMRADEVCKALCIDRVTLWRRVKAGDFPNGVKMFNDSRALIWWEDEVAAFQQAVIDRQGRAA